MKTHLKWIVGFAALAIGLMVAGGAKADEAVGEDIAKRFEYLSTNGNSNCSRDFMESIATMPATARLQGSCCSPMGMHRYSEQVAALRKYKAIVEIPADPYDVEAATAQKLLAAYDMDLRPEEQAAYDYAMENSSEGGPCCCQCWRWHVFGGLGKMLIRDRGFTGEQVANVWDLSDGCGGDDEHHH